jgi:hypothetical protein
MTDVGLPLDLTLPGNLTNVTPDNDELLFFYARRKIKGKK